MLILSIIFFLLAAVLGVTMISYILLDKNVPKGLAFIHGPLAAIGLVLLIIYSVMNYSGPYIAILLFIVAALLGPVVFYRDITGKKNLKGLASIHGIIAIIAFLLLLMFVLFV